jgi:hypothetical protein
MSQGFGVFAGLEESPGARPRSLMKTRPLAYRQSLEWLTHSLLRIGEKRGSDPKSLGLKYDHATASRVLPLLRRIDQW